MPTAVQDLTNGLNEVAEQAATTTMNVAPNIATNTTSAMVPMNPTNPMNSTNLAAPMDMLVSNPTPTSDTNPTKSAVTVAP